MKRKGRGIDHTWRIISYKGDIGLYARCRCGHTYLCRGFGEKELLLYSYCPCCGAHKKWYRKCGQKAGGNDGLERLYK